MNKLLQAMREAIRNKYEPTPEPGMVRVYDPKELVKSSMLSAEEAAQWTTPRHFRDAPHPGWCAISGCPRAKQINGSEICRHHADGFGY